MPSVSEFLIERMVNAGIGDVFTVPGDYSLAFCKLLSDNKKIKLINTTDENHAGFAADAYARVKGIGAVCVTYNVGALKIANAVAGAFAERAPLVVICGSPGMKERGEGVLLHHMVRSFECQKDIFENITCASTVLSDPNHAGYEIDRVFEALKFHKQPIYIELPRDIADKPIHYDVYKQGTPDAPKSDPENLMEALVEMKNWISTAKNPVILAGVQLARYDLGTELIKFAEKANIPVATTLLSKSVVSETHPLYAGIYAGGASQDGVQDLVEKSDCLLMFGVLVTDMTLAFKPSRFMKRQIMSCSVEKMQIKNHTFDNVLFKDFCEALFKSEVARKDFELPTKPNTPSYFEAKPVKITTARLFEKLNCTVTECMAIIADVGDAMFGAMDLTVHHRNQFLSPAFYTSMGYAIPGALGLQTAVPHIRPLVITGDGSFQMSCGELSTIVARKLNPIIIVINNKGYTTERFLIDGPFNNIANWQYHKLPELIGGGVGFVIESEDQLEKALAMAIQQPNNMYILNVHIDPFDVSPGLRRFTKGLQKKL